MKLGGSVYMWCLIIYIYFKRFIRGFFDDQSYSADNSIPDSEIVGTDAPLMYSEVEEAFERTKPAPENPSTPA
jgi:hypothetical protein